MFLNLAMLAFHPPVSVSGALTRDTHLVSGLESEARSWVSKLGLHAYFMGQVSTHELPLASAGGGGRGGRGLWPAGVHRAVGQATPGRVLQPWTAPLPCKPG